jgi:hypothetical protein
VSKSQVADCRATRERFVHFYSAVESRLRQSWGRLCAPFEALSTVTGCRTGRAGSAIGASVDNDGKAFDDTFELGTGVNVGVGIGAGVF